MASSYPKAGANDSWNRSPKTITGVITNIIQEFKVPRMSTFISSQMNYRKENALTIFTSKLTGPDDPWIPGYLLKHEKPKSWFEPDETFFRFFSKSNVIFKFFKIIRFYRGNSFHVILILAIFVIKIYLPFVLWVLNWVFHLNECMA